MSKQPLTECARRAQTLVVHEPARGMRAPHARRASDKHALNANAGARMPRERQACSISLTRANQQRCCQFVHVSVKGVGKFDAAKSSCCACAPARANASNSSRMTRSGFESRLHRNSQDLGIGPAVRGLASLDRAGLERGYTRQHAEAC